MKFKKSLIFCSVMALLAACTQDKEPIPVPTITTVTTTTTPQAVSYQTDIKPIMATYCYKNTGGTCHVTNSSTGDFSMYSDVKYYADSTQNPGNFIYFRVFEDPNNPMPQAATTGPHTLAASDAQKLKSWLLAGYPNN